MCTCVRGRVTLIPNPNRTRPNLGPRVVSAGGWEVACYEGHAHALLRRFHKAFCACTCSSSTRVRAAIGARFIDDL